MHTGLIEQLHGDSSALFTRKSQNYQRNVGRVPRGTTWAKPVTFPLQYILKLDSARARSQTDQGQWACSIPQGSSYWIVVMLVVLVFEPSGDQHRTATTEQKCNMLGLDSASDECIPRMNKSECHELSPCEPEPLTRPPLLAGASAQVLLYWATLKGNLSRLWSNE